MPSLKIVSQVDNTSKIFFGAWVTLEDDSEKNCRYRIVGADELDNNEAYISIDSPLARALLGKVCDDEISLQLGSESQNHYILKIEYTGEN